MTTPLKDPADYQPLAAFRYGLRKFLRFSKELLRREGQLTPEQYEALLALKAFSGNTGLSMTQLSERLQVKHHTAVSLTDKLVTRRLVTRKRQSDDRRKVYVALTSSGTALLARLAALHRAHLRTLAAELISALRALER
jgi:DNA-binding MarR family transcriptional regulator